MLSNNERKRNPTPRAACPSGGNQSKKNNVLGNGIMDKRFLAKYHDVCVRQLNIMQYATNEFAFCSGRFDKRIPIQFRLPSIRSSLIA